MIAVRSWTINLVVHKRIVCWTNVMHFANQTDSLVHTNPMSEDGRKEIWTKKFFIRRKCMSWCYQAFRCRPKLATVCATPAVLLCTVRWHSLCTANCCQYAPHYTQMFRCQVVAPALWPPGFAYDDRPAWRSSHLNSNFTDSRYSWTTIFGLSIFRGHPF